MEDGFVDTPTMPRKLVNYPLLKDVPDIHKPISATGRGPMAVPRPGTLKQVLFKSVLMATHDVHAPVGRGVRPHIPYPKRVVHTIGQKRVAICMKCHASHAISMTPQFHADFLHAEIPDLNNTELSALSYTPLQQFNEETWAQRGEHTSVCMFTFHSSCCPFSVWLAYLETVEKYRFNFLILDCLQHTVLQKLVDLQQERMVCLLFCYLYRIPFFL
jgi:hypothetical protein